VCRAAAPTESGPTRSHTAAPLHPECACQWLPVRGPTARGPCLHRGLVVLPSTAVL
jgi:hypothetical protein